MDHVEQSNQIQSEQVSLHEIMEIFTKRWKILVILALLSILGALVKHKFFPSYPARGILLIKNPTNSRYQLLLNSISGSLGEFGSEDAGPNDSATQAVTFLDTHYFYERLAERFYESYQKDKENRPVFEKLFKSLLSIKDEKVRTRAMAQRLRGKYTFASYSDGQVKISVKTGNKKLSFLLIQTVLEGAKDELIKRELSELEQAEKYFTSEIDSVKKRLDQIENQTINKMQKNQMLSVDIEKGETSRYLTELRKNINDINIKINENNILIRNLKRKRKRNKDKSQGRFSEAAQIESLLVENKDLKARLKSNTKYLKRYGKKQKGLLPFQHEMEKMRANYTFEYKVYESLRRSLARIGLQKTYTKNKIEILEPEFLERIRSRPGIIIIILAAFMVSQIIGLGAIYLYELFKA